MQTSSYRSCLTALGSEIRKRRESLGLTQEEAGEILSLDRVYVGYIEQGRRAPSLRTLISISKAYGVPVSTFFSSDFEAALATLELASSLDDDQMTHKPSGTSAETPAGAPAKQGAKRGKRAASASAKRAPAETAVRDDAGKQTSEKGSPAAGSPGKLAVIGTVADASVDKAKRAAAHHAKTRTKEHAQVKGHVSQPAKQPAPAGIQPAKAPLALVPADSASRLVTRDAVDQVAGVPDARGEQGDQRARMSDDTVTDRVHG